MFLFCFFTQAFLSCMLVYQQSMHDTANNKSLFIFKALFTIHIALKQHNKKKKHHEEADAEHQQCNYKGKTDMDTQLQVEHQMKMKTLKSNLPSGKETTGLMHTIIKRHPSFMKTAQCNTESVKRDKTEADPLHLRYARQTTES